MSSPVAGTKHDQRTTITPRECKAMRILHEDGWVSNVLGMVFEISEQHTWPHINGECNHREP